MVAGKMVWTKWYKEKMVWAKWYGQNGIRRKGIGQNGTAEWHRHNGSNFWNRL